jgi:hypothetical protein
MKQLLFLALAAAAGATAYHFYKKRACGCHATATTTTSTSTSSADMPAAAVKAADLMASVSDLATNEPTCADCGPALTARARLL